jgi:ferric-dicitrate binding protein FerR (iron transport regulator)
MNDAELLELNELCNALADDRLTDAQRARLNLRLAGSEEARRFYVRFTGLSSSLGSYAAELQTEQKEKPRIIPFPQAVWWSLGALAAAIALAMIFGWRVRNTLEPDSVAWVTDSQDAEWSSAALATGDSLARGQRVDLRKGRAEFTFDSGARVMLEGPASLDVQSAWSAGLRSGSLVANTTAEAAGFRVTNPAVNVTNLGGQVSVVAGSDGGAEVYALEGTADTSQPGRGTHTVLRDRQSRRFTREGSAIVPDAERKLVRLASRANLERRPRPIHYARWSFDADLIPQTSGFTAWPFAASVRDSSGGVGEALLATGRWRNALILDGHSFASERPRGDNLRTIACWVRIPSDAPLGEDAAILAWPRRAHTARIAWNRDAERGPLGALCTEQDGQLIVGHTNVRDGQWHHVAVLFLGGGKKAPGMVQVKQFVDGKLDGTAAFSWNEKPSAPAAAAGNLLTIGRAGAASSAADGFVGAIDELFIADRPLAPFELRQLMEKNELPGGA